MIRVDFTKDTEQEVRQTASELGVTLERVRELVPNSEFMVAEITSVKRMSPRENDIVEHFKYIPHVYTTLK